MKFSIAALGLAATVLAVPQAAPDNLKPEGKAPEGCSPNHDGEFAVSIFKLGNGKRDVNTVEKRDCAGPNTLLLNLKDGILKDRQGRTGSIVANFQFQFDGPPQAGAIYTAGFSTCNNGSLAIGPSTVFYQCLSGDFYNLYDRHWAEQCEPVEIVAMDCNAKGKPGNGADSGKKPVGTEMVVTTVVTVIADGQPQVHTTTIPVPMCQIGDGQIQAHTTPCDKVPVNPPVTQISDGQIQAPTNPPVITQISDGQIQAPTRSGGAPISQISDGQIQAPTTGAPVTQISDGQVQVPTSAPSQITAAAGKALPQAMGALAAAGMGAVFFL